MSSFSARSAASHDVPAAPGRPAAEGLAHGKTILLGEHAVVYGHPAIAAPVPGLRVRVEAARAPGPLRILDAASGGPAPELGQTAAVTAVCAALGVSSEGLRITVDDAIPHGRGFGSSAAWGVALVRALTALHGLRADEDEELSLVAHLEAAAHGRASGVDAHAAAARPGLLRFAEGRSAPLPVPSECPAALLVLDSGISASTFETVAAVARELERAPASTRGRIDRIGELTAAAERMLRSGDADGVGAAMTENHTLLRELDLSTPELEALVASALDAGALGAKLSGGGRGGCVVALCPSSAEAEDLGARLSGSTAGHWVVELHTGTGA